MSYDRLNFLSDTKPNLPPLSQLLDSKQQQQQQQQQMIQGLEGSFSGYSAPAPAPVPAPQPVAPKNLEHDEKCPFRTDNQPRIPRPRNAFILFRQHHHQAVLDEGNVIKTNPDVSRELGKRWRALPPAEKEYWNKQAEDEKRRHSEKYPGYRYVPRRSGRKGNCPACKARAAQKAAAAAASHEPEYQDPYQGMYPGYRPMPGSLPPLWQGQMIGQQVMPMGQMGQVLQVPQVSPSLQVLQVAPSVSSSVPLGQMPQMSPIPQVGMPMGQMGMGGMGMNMNMNMMNMGLGGMNMGMGAMNMGMGGMMFDNPKDEREMVSLPHLGSVLKKEEN